MSFLLCQRVQQGYFFLAPPLGEAMEETVRAKRTKAAEGGGGGRNRSSARLESELTGGLGCGRGMSSDDRDAWATVTSEVYWNPTATVTAGRRSQVAAQVGFLCLELISEICIARLALQLFHVS